VGGVLGGAVLQGTANVGDKVWLYPGITKPILITIKSLNSNGVSYKTVRPGGLIAVGTEIDSFYCFSDRMVGQLICSDTNKPDVSSKISINYNKIDRLIEPNQTPLKVSEKIVLIIGSAAYLATIIKIKGNELQLVLDKDAVYYKNDTIAISRNVNSRWRLSGYGQIK
jgi:translation initiation factor 2 subunit 3